MELTLQIKFDSDWHIGEGAGQQGHIDRLVRRTPGDELPYVPAKTITGVWRDACELVAAGLDAEAKDGECHWSEIVDAIFGDQPAQAQGRAGAKPPHGARLSVRPAHLSDALRRHLRPHHPLHQALTFIKAGVKIDESSGQAVDEHLRFEEVVRGGVALESSCSLNVVGLSQDQIAAAKALLWAGTKAVRRLGGKRRRGLGRCTLNFQCDTSQALPALEDTPPRLPPMSNSSAGATAIPDAPADADGWQMLPLTVSLGTPAVVPERTVGNVVYSLDFVPGTYLLGHVTRLLQAHLGDAVTAHIARGDIQVSNAYLEVDKQRGLPVPFAVHFDKDKGGLEDGQKVWNLLQETPGKDQATQLKQHRSGFVGGFDGATLPIFDHVRFQQKTHNTINDERQRPTEEEGGVFTYEAMQAGTVFHGMLRMRKAIADDLGRRASEWWKLLTGPIRIGIAKKDDYGAATLEVAAPRDVRSDVKASGNTLTVWLLSDMLLRDKGLRPTAAIEAVAEAMGETLKVKLTPCRTQIRTRRTEGWHVTWGLSRPSYVGLMAGSCVRFDVEGTLTDTALQDLEKKGLGERRAEGFGEVRFNHPLLTTEISKRSPRGMGGDTTSGSDAAPLIAEGDPNHAYARIIERAAWRNGLRRVVTALWADDAWRKTKLGWNTKSKRPPNSQLGALRAVIGNLTSYYAPADPQAPSAPRAKSSGVLQAVQWLDHLRATPNRKDKWPDGGESIRRLLEAPETVWTWLREREQNEFPTLTPDGQQALQIELWAEAVRALVFAAIRAEQRQRERGDQGPAANAAAEDVQ
jgi:CRISPR-associated protein Csx10